MKKRINWSHNLPCTLFLVSVTYSQWPAGQKPQVIDCLQYLLGLYTQLLATNISSIWIGHSLLQNALIYPDLSAFWGYLGVSHCLDLASGFYSDFTSQMPDKISTGSTTYPQTQYWQAKLASFSNNFWHPFLQLTRFENTIIFDASFSSTEFIQ